MNFQQYWLTLKRRWLPASTVFVSVASLTGIALASQRDIYEAEGKLRFTREDRATSLTGVGIGRESSSAPASFDSLVRDSNPINTEMELMRSAPVIDTTINQLNLKNSNGTPLSRNQFLSRLTLTTNRGTDVLRVSYRDQNPEVAKNTVKALISVYLDKHLQDNRAEIVAARNFLQQRLPEAEANVRKADAALRQFKEINQVTSLEEEQRSLVASAKELQRRTVEAQSELANSTAQTIAFNNKLGMDPQEAIAVTSLSQSSTIQETLKQLQTLDAQLAADRARFQNKHPSIVAVETRRSNLNALLDQEVEKALDGQTITPGRHLQSGEIKAVLLSDYVRSNVRTQGLERQVATFTKASTAYQNRISILPRLEQEQRELTRQVEAAQSTYSLMLQRLHEARVAENQNVGNARVIQPASVLENPIAPRRLSFLATGALFGILLGVATALALEFNDKSIRTVKEAREIFGYTLLGMILSYKFSDKVVQTADEISFSEIVVRDFPNSSLSEAYRMLQANLKFLSSDRAPKSIVVTSSVPKEGKSTVSANLAMSMVQFGHKVLLIDADMRCPSQHAIWEIVNEVGLSNVIVEQIDPTTAVKHINPMLHVLTSGVMPPNPATLLDSKRMASLMKSFVANYDYVIIDAPALNVAADVPILGKIADGILMVVRPGVVDAASATLAKERLEQSGQNVLGQVINGIIHENEPYSYYYFTDSYYGEQNYSERTGRTLINALTKR
jgi:capsular exopolysaccharide synthesis family protein